MADGDNERISACMISLGFKTRHMLPSTMCMLANSLFDTCPPAAVPLPSTTTHDATPQVLVLTPDMVYHHVADAVLLALHV